MTTTDSTFRVHCHFCGMLIRSDFPAILHNDFPICAMCELAALMQDPAFAWTQDEAPVLTPADEGWWA